MYCPNCGQQQTSDQMRFCSRCGFPLSIVSEVLANNGFLPQLSTAVVKKLWLTRRNVFFFGLIWFLLSTLIIIPITAILFGDTGAGEVFVPLVAIIGTMGGLLLMLFSLFFPSAAKRNAETQHQKQNFNFPSQLNAADQQPALPPQSANFNSVNAVYNPPKKQPLRGGWRDAKTGELIQPSVTEGTTRLLDKDE